MTAEPETTDDGTVVSVVVPYSPVHTPGDILDDALGTARSQSIQTDILVVEDSDQRGPSWARNRGLERATTRYVALLDADDYWYEEKLTRQLEAMRESDAAVCVEGGDLSRSQFVRELYLGNISSITSSVLLDTAQIDVTFEEELERREDHLFVLEAATKGGVCFVDDLFTVGGHNESLSQDTPILYRFKQDYHFSRYVRERVPEVRAALQHYERLRCEPDITNTPGDIFRLVLLWPSLLAVIGLGLSVLCQRRP